MSRVNVFLTFSIALQNLGKRIRLFLDALSLSWAWRATNKPPPSVRQDFNQDRLRALMGRGALFSSIPGSDAIQSQNNLLTTIGYRLGGETAYAIEGSIFIAGAAVQWLRDELGVISSAKETEALARSLDSNQGVYLVPAFAGLGAPHWRADARGAIYGLTRGSGKAALARAALECVAYQTLDLMDAIAADGVSPRSLRIDGGMVANSWLAQFLSDIIDLPVEIPQVMETTALGAAYLAGLQAGIYKDTDDIASQWRRQSGYKPTMQPIERGKLVTGWRKAIERTLMS